MDPYELAMHFGTKICESIEKLAPVKTDILTNVHQEFCNVAIKISFAMQTETDEYTLSFNAYSILSIVDKMNGGNGKVLKYPNTILKELKVWQDVLQGALDILFEGTEFTPSFYPVNLNKEKGLEMARSEIQVDNASHEFIFSYTSVPHKEVTLKELDKLYTTFNMPEPKLLGFNKDRPILTDEEIDALSDHENFCEDILSQEEIDALLDTAEEDVLFIEDKRHLISRMLLYVMIANEEGLLRLTPDIHEEKDPLTRTLLDNALGGEELEKLVNRANEGLSSLEFTDAQSKPEYQINIKIVLKTIQCLYAAKGLKEASIALGKFLK